MLPFMPIFKKSKLFTGLSEQEILAALSCLRARVREYKKGEVLFSEGERVELCLVLSGEVEIQKVDFSGNANIISRLFPSELAGAAACYSQKGLPFDMVCAFDCQIMLLSGENLIRQCPNACDFHARLIGNMLSLIADRNILLAEKIDILTKRTTREKILSLLHGYSKRSKNQRFSVNLTRSQMADFLSVNRSAMIRELTLMQKDNIIGTCGNLFWFIKKA